MTTGTPAPLPRRYPCARLPLHASRGKMVTIHKSKTRRGFVGFVGSVTVFAGGSLLTLARIARGGNI